MSSFIDTLDNWDRYYCFDDYYGHYNYGYLKMLPEESGWEDRQGSRVSGTNKWSDGRTVLTGEQFRKILDTQAPVILPWVTLKKNTRLKKPDLRPDKETHEKLVQGFQKQDIKIEVLKPVINIQPHLAYPIGTTVWIGGHIEAKIDEILFKKHYVEYLCIWFTNSERKTMWCAEHHFTFEKQNTPVWFITE